MKSALLLTLLAAAPPAVASAQTMFRGNPAHTGVYDSAPPVQLKGVKWSFPTGGPVVSSRTVVGGIAYVGSDDGPRYAVDLATGAQKWKFTTGGPVRATPAVAEGTVYVSSRESNFYALDAATGQEKWKVKITWINASPAVRDGRVYFGTSIPAFFVALDARTGQEQYRFDAHEPVFSSPALAGSLGLFGSFNGSLYAVDLATGKLAWEFRTEAAKKNAAACLNPDGGLNFPAVFPSRYFEEGMFHAGQKLFAMGAIVSSPVVDHGVVYVGSADGNLYALE